MGKDILQNAKSMEDLQAFIQRTDMMIEDAEFMLIMSECESGL